MQSEGSETQRTGLLASLHSVFPTKPFRTKMCSKAGPPLRIFINGLSVSLPSSPCFLFLGVVVVFGWFLNFCIYSVEKAVIPSVKMSNICKSYKNKLWGFLVALKVERSQLGQGCWIWLSSQHFDPPHQRPSIKWFDPLKPAASKKKRVQGFFG